MRLLGQGIAAGIGITFVATFVLPALCPWLWTIK